MDQFPKRDRLLTIFLNTQVLLSLPDVSAGHKVSIPTLSRAPQETADGPRDVHTHVHVCDQAYSPRAW